MSDPGTAGDDRTASFGPFRLMLGRQMLLEGEIPVRLGSRALEILTTLVERPGELVSKTQLIERVWPNAVVEDATLRVHIAALRKVLGDGHEGRRYLANIPGRGYQFVADVVLAEGRSSPQAAPAETIAPAHGLPMLLTRLVGREELIAALAGDVGRERLLTLVGPGGIGKTTVALSIAHRIAANYRDGVRFIDLAPLSDPALVPLAVAASIGMGDALGGAVSGLAARLRDKQMLIVLDSCEHVVAAAATLAEEVLRAAPGVAILATSREPLRTEGERVQRLAPLRVPAQSANLTAADALTYPAVRLFVERATAGADSFELDDRDAPVVAEICRRLDGIALAIELAAGRIDTLGVREIATLLDNRLGLLTRGRRTALPRHQTLRATLDWSHELLPEQERVILRRLGVFAGWFTADAALAVIVTDTGQAPDLEGLANLVAKSLVAADVGGSTAYYRLLDTMRAYALEKLAEAGEATAVARRHANYYAALLEAAETDWETKPTHALLVAYGRQLGNVRVALDWAFGPHGDPGLAVALTAAAVPLWKHLSLMEECRSRVNQALARLRLEPGPPTQRDMRLYAALGATLLSTISSTGADIAAAWTSTLDVAESLGDVDYQLRALWGLWLGGYHSAHHRAALGLAERFRSLAASAHRPADALVGDRMLGVSLHLLGRLGEARVLVQRAVEGYVGHASSSDILRFQFDQSVTARSAYSQILWLQGFADQAMRNATTTLDDALAIDHGLSVCDTLAQSACPIALQNGDLDLAEEYIAMLLARAEKDELRMWSAWGECYRGMLLSGRGQHAEGVAVLRNGLANLPAQRFVPRQLGLVASLADCERRGGDLRACRLTVDTALAMSEQNEELWCLPELLRIKGELVLAQGLPTAAEDAERYLKRAVAVAHVHGALGFELRAATSLARMAGSAGRAEDARGILRAVHDRVAEGFGTQDVLAAREVLAADGAKT